MSNMVEGSNFDLSAIRMGMSGGSELAYKDIIAKNIGETGVNFANLFGTAVRNCVKDVEHKNARDGEMPPQTDDDQIIPLEQILLERAANDISASLPDTLDLPDVEAALGVTESDPDRKKKLLANRKLESEQQAKKMKTMVKNAGTEKRGKRNGVQ